MTWLMNLKRKSSLNCKHSHNSLIHSGSSIQGLVDKELLAAADSTQPLMELQLLAETDALNSAGSGYRFRGGHMMILEHVH